RFRYYNSGSLGPLSFGGAMRHVGFAGGIVVFRSNSTLARQHIHAAARFLQGSLSIVRSKAQQLLFGVHPTAAAILPAMGFRGAPKRIIVQVGISRRGCHLSVP